MTTGKAERLEDIPNIGKSIASDLRAVCIQTPRQLAMQQPLQIYLKLGKQMGRRHDPCVLYTLLAAHHYMQTGEAVKWWEFTEAGRRLLSGAE